MKKNTLIINLYGGPGAGKSTFMAKLFYNLKCRGIDVEMAPEYAKDIVWEERLQYLDEQIYVFAKQLHRINRINGKVDVCICDSPLLLSSIYLKEDNPEFKALINKEFAKFNNLNFYVKRGDTYMENGRLQTEDQAKEVDKQIEDLLKDIPHHVITHDTDINEIINKYIMNKNES